MENQELNIQPENLEGEIQNLELTDSVETPTAPVEQVQTPFLEVKYNKEGKALSKEEAIEYAQKGMNYDHIKGELDNFKKYESGINLLKELAEESGVSVDDLVAYQKEQKELAKIQKTAQDKGINDDDFAKEFYELKKKADQWDAKLREDETKAQAAARKEKENIELLDYFKEINGREADIQKDFPTAIFEIAEKEQVSLKSAYAMYQVKAFKEKQAIEQKNEENALSSTGSVSSNGNTQEITFTEESISKMSEKEMAKHWNNPLFRKIAGLDRKRKDD